MTPRFMLRTFAVFSLPLLAGCASSLTPKQQTTFAQFDGCRRATEAWSVQLEKVDVGGAFSIRGPDIERNKVRDCMIARFGHRFGSQGPR